MLQIHWTPEATYRWLMGTCGPNSAPWLQRVYYPNAKEDYGVYHLHRTLNYNDEPGVTLTWTGSLEFIDEAA